MHGAVSLEPARPAHPNLLLGLLLLTQFLVVLLDVDATLALPAIQRDLGFSVADLQWVQTAYMIGFGGFLLLAGRGADLLGRRRVLVGGLAVFTLASVWCGIAPSAVTLVLGRAVQGFGSALAAAAALSIVTVTFTRGAERDRALGLYGLVSGIAATLGLLVGGVVTELMGWRWVFLIMVPVSAAAALAILRVVPPYPGARGAGRLDVAGAVTASAAIALLVLGVSEAGSAGWTDAAAIGPLLGAVALGAAFVARERRAAAPILPLGVLRLRNVVGGNAATLVFGAMLLGVLALMSIYLQDARGLSPIECGLWMLPTGLGSLTLSVAASRLVGRFGFRRMLAVALVLTAAGAGGLSAAGADGSLWLVFLPAAVLFGIGICFAEVSSVITTSEDLGHGADAGLSSGLWSTSTQVGGAIGLGVMAAVMAQGADGPGAAGVAAGFQDAMLLGAGIGAVGVAIVLAVVRDRHRQPTVPTA
jgi:EmrB/QacA subfamily drug resistance transporter